MKLSKLLRKVSAAVSALMIVGMLAACSSPSGGGSGSGSGDGTKTDPNNPNGTQAQQGTDESGAGLPALDANTEYIVAFDDSISAAEQENFADKAGIENGDTVTAAEVNAVKDAFEKRGYTYTISGTTITIKKKPTETSNKADPKEPKDTPQQDVVGTYTLTDSESGLTYTITAKVDGTYTASASLGSVTKVVEEGTYVVKNNKVTTTKTKMMGQSGSLEEVPAQYIPYASTTYTIGADNVLTPDIGGSNTTIPGGNGGTANQATTTNAEYTYTDEDGYKLNITATTDGKYVAKITGLGTVEEGTYTITGNKVTTCALKGMNENYEYVTLTVPEITTYLIGTNNVLTEAKDDKDSGSTTKTDSQESTSGGKTNNTSINETTQYTVLFGYYGENHTGDKDSMTGKSFLEYVDEYELVEVKDYVVSGTTIRITALGLYKIFDKDCFDWMYNDAIFCTLHAEVSYCLEALELEEGKDYSIDEDNRILTILTKTAYDKIVVASKIQQ